MKGPLLFLGRGSAFADEQNSAFFTEDNELVLIDCPATSYQKIKKMDWAKFDNIFILVTHTHGDHSGSVGTMLQYVWFASGMKKKVTVVAPSEEVRKDLELLLMLIEGCEKEWLELTTADRLGRKWLISSVPTVHVKPLEGRCFGYHLNVGGKNVIYTGDSSTIEPFMPYISEGTYLYTEAAFYKSDVHMYLRDKLPDFVRLTEEGVHVYLMHLDNEEEIKKMIAGTPLQLAELWNGKAEVR
ncbi:MAG: ribonuclease Z [Ruminococcus sp.]|nr:ribonuclease Z [Ruminococcus sp.]